MRKIICGILCLFVVPKLTKALELDSVLMARYQDIVKNVRKELIPDKRTEVLEVRVVDGILQVETTRPDALERFRSQVIREGLARPFEILLPDRKLKDKVYGLVRLSVANHRQEPAHSAEMVTQSLLGTPVELLKQERGYYLVRSPDRYISWISGEEVTPVTVLELGRWRNARRAVFIPEYGHSFSKPSREAARVSDLVSGNILEVLGKEKKFTKVKYPDGRVAWVPEKELMAFEKWASRPLPSAEEILKTAQRFVGVPYLWGGTSVKGMDCSGFTRTSYFLNGVLLSRDASQQALYGEKIDIHQNDTLSIDKCLANLKPGDLLFFASGRARSLDARVTHTAIYIGDGEFIQAAGMIRINSMKQGASNYADFQSRTIVGARRILNSVGKEGISRIDQHEFYKSASK